MKPSSILVVDDTPENLTVLRDILTRAGYRVRPVLQGALALKSATADPPDLILLDIMMPGMDGYELCQGLKADPRTLDIPVLFISALDATENKLRGFEVGGLDYISKPFRAEEVLARVRTHISLREARQQLSAQNDELRHAAALREDVEKMLRHDLRGALSNVIGYSELLGEELAPGSAAAKHARVLVGAGYAMLSMLQSSFDLMKMERGLYEQKGDPFDVAEVIRQVIGEFGLAFARKHLPTRVQIAEADPDQLIVLGERLLSHSLFHNLVKNAIEASPESQAVEFHLAPSNGRMEIRVRNSGAVPEAIRERFFDKFVTYGKADGTGLGTYSAKLMAETQGGTIRLDASEPEHTSIIVSLPLATAAQTARYRAARTREREDLGLRAGPAEFPPIHLLIADDDDANRAYLRRILPSPPLQLSFAANGHEALAVLQEQAPAVALIDLEMPAMDGWETARRYREWQRAHESASPASILIAFSSHQDQVTREKCLGAGFDRILVKPAARKALLDELRQALSRHSSIIHLDRETRELIPDFLKQQHSLIRQLESVIDAGDCPRLRSLAHRLQGSFAMYGLQTASGISSAIEEAGEIDNFARARHLTAELRTHLETLEFRYT